MQSKTPFLFSMPPLFAWAFAVTTSIALLLALLLMFTETTVESEEGTQGIEEAPVERQVLSSTGQAVFIGLLIGSVGLTPLMARRKRMSATRWSIAGVGTGFVYLLAGGLPLVHPLMVLLALVFLHPKAPAVPPPQSLTGDSPDAGVVSVDAPPPEGRAAPTRRRTARSAPRRRRRPRY